jgi:hypothetical protein
MGEKRAGASRRGFSLAFAGCVGQNKSVDGKKSYQQPRECQQKKNSQVVDKAFLLLAK